MAMMCRLLEVSLSGYYDLFDHPEYLQVKLQHDLIIEIRRAHMANRGIHGSLRIHRESIDQGERFGLHPRG